MSDKADPDSNMAVFPTDTGEANAIMAVLTEYSMATDKPITLHIGPTHQLAQMLEYLMPDVPDDDRRDTQAKMIDSGAKEVLATTTGDILRAATYNLDQCHTRHALLDTIYNLGLVGWDDLPALFRQHYTLLMKRQRQGAGQSVH